ncbi:Spt20 family-domain-containing protein [Phyllosticta capitalensis]
MTTMGPIRPSQGLRQRRESTRPSQLRSSTRIAHNEADDMAAAGKVPEKPPVFTEEYILKKFFGHKPSLKLHLYDHYFRFEHQDGNWSYNSPMKSAINHIRERTVPHEMVDEMNRMGVPWYDGCLIVRTYNYRSMGNKAPAQSSAKKDNVVPGSIHNWNDHLTPSPFVPFPSQSSNSPKDKRPSSSGSQQGKEKTEALQGARQAGTKGPVENTIVLFPTELSKQAERLTMATTPMPDLSRRQARTAQTPISAHPPTPINSIPPTPSIGRPAKRQRMILDETNIHDFEAGVINSTAPALYLEPAHSMGESLDIIEATTHPMNKNPPPALKTRKRTTAELAADEAQFNADQSFMLFGDSSGVGAGAAQMNGEGEGLRGGGSTFDVQFSRFRVLETIKIEHEEAERAKKEEEARQAQLKREQAANEARMREREAANQQQAEHNRLMAQQEQQRQQALQQEQMRRAQAAAAQASGNMMGSQQHHMQMTQPQQNSPMVRHQTPMQASPVMNANAVATHAMGGVPMAPTSSSQAGSPPRPSSAIQHSAGTQHMARQMSRQQSSQHPGSTHGTPQMVQGTPQLGQAVPVTRHMTPQPGRVNQHGSPVGMQGTPMMMNTPQMQVSGMSQEQQMIRLQQMRRLQQQNAMANGSPQNMSQEQMQILRQQHLAQVQAQNQMAQHQQGSNVGTPQQYNAQLQQQMRSQMSQLAGGTPNGVQQRPPGQGNPMMGNTNNVNMANMTPQQQQALRMKQRREQMILRMVHAFGGSLPPQIQHLIQTGGNEGFMRAWQLTLQHQASQQQNQGQQQNPNQQGGVGQGMNMGGMGNMGQMGQMNMGGMNMGNMNMGTVTTGTGQNGATQASQMPVGNGGNMHQMEMMRQMQIRHQQQQAAQAVANQQHAQQQVQNGGQGGGQGGGPGGMPGGGDMNQQQVAQQQYMARLIRQQQILSQRNQMQAQQQQQGQQQGGVPQQQMMGQMNGMGGMWQQGGGMRPGQPGSMG